MREKSFREVPPSSRSARIPREKGEKSGGEEAIFALQRAKRRFLDVFSAGEDTARLSKELRACAVDRPRRNTSRQPLGSGKRFQATGVNFIGACLNFHVAFLSRFFFFPRSLLVSLRCVLSQKACRSNETPPRGDWGKLVPLAFDWSTSARGRTRRGVAGASGASENVESN